MITTPNDLLTISQYDAEPGSALETVTKFARLTVEVKE